MIAVEDTLDQPLRVLVANAEDFTRVFLRRALARHALVGEIREATDGVQALKLLASGHFDVLIVDLAIPVLSGLDLLEFIGSDREFRPTEIVVTTGLASEQAVRRAIELGADDYILKPYSSQLLEQRLLLCVNRLQEKRKLASEAGETEAPRLLVADPDLNFCAMAKSVLGADYKVDTVHAAPHLLSACLQQRPGWLLASPDLRGMDLNWIVPKLKKITPNLKAYLLTDGAMTEEAPPGFDGYFEKTFVPERLLAGLKRLLQGGDEFGFGSDVWVETLQRESKSAVRQVFGMMTGTEPELVDDPDAGASPSCVALDLKDSETDFTCHCTIGYDQAMGRAVFTELAGVDAEDAEEEDLLSTVSELLNMIAGRVKACCDDRGTDLKMGLPKIADGDQPQHDGALFQVQSWFQWRDLPSFCFTVTGVEGAPGKAQA